MAKKHLEPFNPWPGFVDLFASVIMVVLIFMLVLIVNITYYAQFKYKISYTGSSSVQELSNEPITTAAKIDMQKKKEYILDVTPNKEEKDSQKDLQAVAGMDLTVKDSNLTRQENIIYDDWMLIKYNNKEIILDPQTMKDVDLFLKQAKIKFPNHYISIFTAEPKNQASATVSKQIALGRALNIRNLIRSREYKESDVVVRLKDKIPNAQTVDYDAGYGIIMVNTKK
ncbi:MAG TPA: hypothetical protein VLZ29_06400 [Sulfurimonas sp.]|uniref:hypothetical protein n=1 Tax=Sulfurimonas sp. TaxID=2022749 RepID=UPI002C6EE1F1|nr:hypothetical protein [Sulfurimonas sp.]HUH42726.1 hypothetical protein [Sulfurimonas sp.]